MRIKQRTALLKVKINLCLYLSSMHYQCFGGLKTAGNTRFLISPLDNRIGKLYSLFEVYWNFKCVLYATSQAMTSA
jgi:hypothetical protein